MKIKLSQLRRIIREEVRRINEVYEQCNSEISVDGEMVQCGQDAGHEGTHWNDNMGLEWTDDEAAESMKYHPDPYDDPRDPMFNTYSDH